MTQRGILVLVVLAFAGSAFAQAAPAAAPAVAPTPTPTPAPAQGAPDAPAPPPPAAAQPAPLAPPAEEVPPPPPPPPTYPQGAGGPPPAPPPPPPYGMRPVEPLAEPAPQPVEPLGELGLTLGFGFAFGGEKLAAATFSDGSDQSLRAGQGVLIFLGLAIVPFRSAGHSLGLHLDQNVKLEQISARNASITLSRFPLLATLRYGYAFDDTWSFIAGAGLVYEYGIRLSGSGDVSGLDAKFDSVLGPMLEGGVAYRERAFLIDVTLRFTAMKYKIATVNDIDANNAALVIAGHYFF